MHLEQISLQRRAAVALLAAASLLVTACATTRPLGEPENIHFHKQRLVKYYESGSYQTEVGKVADAIKAYLSERLARGDRSAVVFDIDETVLSNWPSIKANDFGWITRGACTLDKDGKPGSPCGLGAWILLGRGEAIQPMRDVYQHARALGAAVFFITGRPDTREFRAATEANLRAAGYAEWAGLILKPPAVELATIPYKSSERRRIAEQGYAVVASIGDQQSDLDGGYAERTFLLPNPFYFVP